MKNELKIEQKAWSMIDNSRLDRLENGLLGKVAKAKDAYEFLLSWKKSVGYRPLTAAFHLTLRCNLRCKMCEIWRFGRENPKVSIGLPKERIFELLYELKAMGTKHIHFSGGECLLRKDFTEILSYATNLGFTISMNTNGTLVTEDVAGYIVNNQVTRVIFSVDSADPRIHDEIRGVGGSWKKTVEGIKHLNKARKESKKDLEISINSVLMKLNYETADELLDMKQELEFDDIKFLPMVTYYSIPLLNTKRVDKSFSNLSITRDEIRTFNNKVSPKIKEKAVKYGFKQDAEELAHPFGKTEEEIENFMKYGRSRNFYSRNHCFIPFIHTEILPSGDLIPCCRALISEGMIPLGNIKERPFKIEWNSREYVEFRQKCHYPSLQMCYDCDSTYMKKNKSIMGYFNLLGPFKKILD